MALTKAEMAEALFNQLGLNKREARELVEGCSICGLEDACALVESLGARLGPLRRAAVEEAELRRVQEQALREQPRLRIVTQPPGAAVLVDGQKIGVTPLEQPLAAAHLFEAAPDDGVTSGRERIGAGAAVRKRAPSSLHEIP